MIYALEPVTYIPSTMKGVVPEALDGMSLVFMCPEGGHRPSLFDAKLSDHMEDWLAKILQDDRNPWFLMAGHIPALIRWTSILVDNDLIDRTLVWDGQKKVFRLLEGA